MSGTGGSSLTIGGTLTNNGTLDIGNTASAKATTVTAAGLANTGTINLTGGADRGSGLGHHRRGAGDPERGSYLAGNALLEFGSGGITAIGNGASLTLNGAKALVALSSAPTTDSALTGLASNAGTLALYDGSGADDHNRFYQQRHRRVDRWSWRRQQPDDRRNADQQRLGRFLYRQQRDHRGDQGDCRRARQQLDHICSPAGRGPTPGP